MKVISRDEAISQGLKTYFTGKLCKHGHASERYTSSTKCVACARISKRKVTDKIRLRREEDLNKNPLYISRAFAKKNGLTRYNPLSKCVNGHISERFTSSGRCINCIQQEVNTSKYKEQRKASYERDKTKVLNAQKEYRENNKDKVRESKRREYIKNKRSYILYRKNNKEKIKESKRQCKLNNPITDFTRRTLNRIEKAKLPRRIDKYESILGYTQEQFIKRIEFQFKNGMSWDNRSEWHIDHKKPIARFLEQGITDPKIINALSNLQPLWASDNLSKGAKFEI